MLSNTYDDKKKYSIIEVSLNAYNVQPNILIL